MISASVLTLSVQSASSEVCCRCKTPGETTIIARPGLRQLCDARSNRSASLGYSCPFAPKANHQGNQRRQVSDEAALWRYFRQCFAHAEGVRRHNRDSSDFGSIRPLLDLGTLVLHDVLESAPIVYGCLQQLYPLLPTAWKVVPVLLNTSPRASWSASSPVADILKKSQVFSYSVRLTDQWMRESEHARCIPHSSHV